ncbi:F-box-like domain superfamily [Arabidopsis thaliana x Arabidopsis arenosa]|uniref:F-box-like domain superfamily n=1 Tax=Arabidopsis thaliana x Arabidopsis arenosa TaxID=1240361 RepID=A0A8T1XSU7_9BRAS|nr:F-box-like domain superfamily [Arabidopsis thaliana x Arabidopsis arenosa]
MEIKSEQDPKWENLSGDILGVIFGKLEMMDVTMGASRVCTSWFLAAQNSTLWNTINLVVSHENSFFYNPRVDPLDLGMDIRKRDRQNALNIGLYFSPYAPQYRQIKEGQNNLRNLLIEITKLSCTAPRNLFFNLYSYIQDKELVLAAERMPNVEKLVLPMWSSLSENSFRDTRAPSRGRELHKPHQLEICGFIGRTLSSSNRASPPVPEDTEFAMLFPLPAWTFTPPPQWPQKPRDP